MQFNVVMSDLANEQYDNFLAYIYHILKNPQAAGNVIEDFDETVAILETQADSFGYCRSGRLKKLGFHKIHLQRHKYILVYRVEENNVIIEGMYHELQDYESAIE